MMNKKVVIAAALSLAIVAGGALIALSNSDKSKVESNETEYPNLKPPRMHVVKGIEKVGVTPRRIGTSCQKR
ncbi:hypothetical protein HW35_12670 [Bacillus sp. X1(2014)]|jgi:hypothetical protein|nr:hypothetical protein HW35_12670 [Bacillus sp. X1(2014)]